MKRAVPNLTPREIEVMTLRLKGHTTSEIGAILSASNRTVENHLGSVSAKLRVAFRRPGDLRDIVFAEFVDVDRIVELLVARVAILSDPDDGTPPAPERP